MNYSMTVYFNPSCGPCNALKDWLKENNIRYVGKDIINDVAAAKEFREYKQSGVPFSVIEENGEKFTVLGANIKKISRILDLDKKEALR
ncbi:glutaredoxin domain-containing protein [Priestia megaterium]|uniref:glutaredoxin domain-containing protein n=1 Tax=Priestia megaterium TaxID=1404 RepID=UPI002E21D6EF|nr:glutaredoxin domain-containing protein [Priestia megaterium]MED4286313.1 glutaredoxin domain-containing protein [Priestia megaterium]